MTRVALQGGAYTARSVAAAAQRSVNLFSEPVPEAQGEPMPAAHYPTPGLRALSVVGPGPIRGIRQATTGAIYCVSGSGVYKVDPTSWAGTHLGDITAGLRTPVSMVDNGLDMVIVDGSANGWHITLVGDVFAQIDNSDGVFMGATRVDYLDTYFLFNKPETPQFYSSDSLALTFDPLWFANKESYSDLLRTLVVVKRDIWLFGDKSTEIFNNVGKPDFPFESAPDIFIDHGIAAPYSVAEYDNGVFWLSADRQGHGIIIMGSGYQTKRISTYAIEDDIAGYSKIDDAIGFCYQIGGHSFYVLTFPHDDKTWSYDITTGLWHEWIWIDSNGDEHRHRANCYWPINGVPVVGDWQNGNLYALDHRVFTDNGQPIKRVRSFPHLVADGKRVFYRQFLADMDTGTSSATAPGTFAFLDATFGTRPDGSPVPDGTNLSAYVSDVGGGWTAVGTATHGVIEDGRLAGDGGDALYVSAVAPPRSDYSVRFNVVPPDYVSVRSATNLFAVGRATGAGLGYRVKVTADGTRYTLTLGVDGTATAASVVMGTITGGVFTVWLTMRGTTITAQVQRSQDGRFLRTDGTWQTATGTIAAQFTDGTYTAAGRIALGGTWPIPAPVTPATINATYAVYPTSDPNFPGGYSDAHPVQAFDFTRNWFYAWVTDPTNDGIAITDLSTMHVIRTATLAQMFAGTAFGPTPGVQYSKDIRDVAASNGSALYIQNGVDIFHEHMLRVDPVTLKVTGDWYVPNGVEGTSGVVNATATHTIVAYLSFSSTQSAKLFDGTGMAFIGLGPTPLYGNGNNCLVIAGARHGDGSCDFIVVNSDNGHPTGLIDIWRVKVSDGLVITSTKTGTANVLATFPAPANLYIAQADYDTAHDCLILQVTNSGVPTGPPIAVMSVAFNGAIRWTRMFPSDIGIPASKGQSQLTVTTVMIGGGGDLTLLDTGTGATVFTGSIPTISASYYRVYDGSRSSYWTYTTGTLGFTRIDYSAPVIPATLGMDDVVATTEAGLNSNLVSLRWSDDRGHSWGNPVSQSIGEAGEYRTSLQWQRLAYARARVFEISWSVPEATALMGCYVDATPGQS